jgi:hypothetical protein
MIQPRIPWPRRSEEENTRAYASLSIDRTTLRLIYALPPPTTIVVTGRDDGNTARQPSRGCTQCGRRRYLTQIQRALLCFQHRTHHHLLFYGGGVFQPLPLTIQVRGTDVSDHNGTPRSVIPNGVGSLGGGLDMSLAMSPDTVKMTLKQNIRACIFRYVKFWDQTNTVPSVRNRTLCAALFCVCAMSWQTSRAFMRRHGGVTPNTL